MRITPPPSFLHLSYLKVFIFLFNIYSKAEIYEWFIRLHLPENYFPELIINQNHIEIFLLAVCLFIIRTLLGNLLERLENATHAVSDFV